METPSRIDLSRSLSGFLRQVLDTQLRVGALVSDRLKQQKLPLQGSCCDIPEPCWMPKNLGEITSHVCPGATAVLRLRITNCDIQPHHYQVAARGAGAPQVTVSPANLTIGPLERDIFTAKFTVPDKKGCEDTEAVILIQGCNAYYVRWVITHAKQGGDCCHELEIEDCPDYVHHWYDHFYCHRPCFYDRRKPTTGKPNERTK